MKIGGSIIQAYMVCSRQAWLMSRQITGDQYNEFLAIGRLFSEETYKRDKKEILIDGNKIDVIKEKNGVLNLIETKKSSRMLKASKMQLLNYLYSLSKKGYLVKGEIRIPKEKKIFAVELNVKEIESLEQIHQSIEELFQSEYAPDKKKIGACKKCSYSEFCWS